MIRAITAKLRNRSAETTFCWVKDTTSEPGCEVAIGGERLVLREYVVGVINRKIDLRFDLKGMELATVTVYGLQWNTREGQI